jgi:pimeloyl-ACP methyl ester carboxylesterase
MTKLPAAVLVAALGLVAAPAVAAPPAGAIAWHRCASGPDDTTGRELDDAGVECADVTVPLDHARPRGRTITVAIARSEAPDPARRAGVLLLNLGGPAGPVRHVVPAARAAMGEAGARFDLIGMDPRFAGASTPIDCGWHTNWLPRSAGRDRRSFDAMVALTRDLAERCGRAGRALIPYASTADTARDMDVVRAALGEAKLSFLGYSQGSYLGAVYAQLFGHRVDRMVLDSAIDPALPGTRVLRTAAPGREAALREWAAWAAVRDGDLHLGATPEAVLGRVHRAYAASARRPLRVGDWRVDDTVLPGLLLGQLADDTENAGLAETVSVLDAAAAGRPAEPTEAMAERLSALLTGDASARHSVQTATLCGDAAVSRDPEWYRREVRRQRAVAPLFGPVAATITPCAAWPVAPREAPVRIGNDVPVLIVQAEKDIDAQLPGARAMHRALSGSRLVVLDDARTHGVYLFRQAPCVDDTVGAYLVTGRLPATDLTCAE